MFQKSVSLVTQLMLTLVGLVVVTTIVLTVAAYRSFQADLESHARRLVRASAEQTAGALTRLVEQRQERAHGFLSSVQSLCGETTPSGRTAWERECAGRALGEFRNTEHARGAQFQYRRRRIARVGDPPSTDLPLPVSFAHIVSRPPGFDYVITAVNGDSTLTVQFSVDDLEMLFRDHGVLGGEGEIFLTDAGGRFLTTPRYGGSSTPAGAAIVEPTAECFGGVSDVIAMDYRGVSTIHGLRQVPLFFGGVCVDAHVTYDEALAPAEALPGELITRGAVFAGLGVLLSLVAAHWIAGPVKRLALSARALEHGDFDRPIRVGGPSEIQGLARGLASMARALAHLVAREQVGRHEAEAANDAKDGFLAVVSHELRSPLTAILGWAQLFRFGRFTGEAAERAVAAIEHAANTQARLVEDLLDGSRIVAGTLNIQKSVVSLIEPTEAAIEAVRPEADSKAVIVQFDVERPIPPVLGDAGRLQQVVSNLLANAIKFTPPGGRIAIRLRHTRGNVELSIADTGEGISAQFLPHVFERFQQAEPSSGSRKGLGLGLSIVHQLVKLHGGDVAVASDGPGKGSSFTVTLPAYAGAIAAVPGADARPVAYGPELELTAARVLLIDDDQETLRVVRAMLEQAGAQVMIAMSVAEARSALAAWRPTVLLVANIVMPDEEGFELMRAFLVENSTVPAIALTARGRLEDADEARAAGFHLCIQKPVRRETLLQAVAALVGIEPIH